jgi:hypothetical protein
MTMSQPVTAADADLASGRFGPGRLALAVSLVAIWFLSLRNATDFDLGWHLANGRHLADGVLLGGVDVYSWTAAGAPWIAHEWLTEVFAAAVGDAAGLTALSVVTALVVAVAFGLVAWRLRRRSLGYAATILAIGLGFAGALVSMGVRPQLLELLYLATTLLIIDAWLDGRLGRWPLWLATAGGALIWANTHGSFPLLPAVLAIVTIAALVGREHRWWQAGVAAGLATVVPVLNPWGLQLYAFAAQSLTSDVTGRLVEEWRPPQLLEPSFLPFTIAVGVSLIGAVAMVRRREGSPARRAADLLLALAFLALALRSGRYVMLFGVAAAPLLGCAFAAAGRGMRALAGRLRRRSEVPANEMPAPAVSTSAGSVARGRDIVDLVVLVVVTGALVVGGSLLVGPTSQTRAMESRYPVALLPALDQIVAEQGPDARLFNEYTWGGWLIETRPDVPVFIDGRSEVYGDPQLERYAAIADAGPDAVTTLTDLGVTVALVKADAPLAAELVAAGWHERAADDVARLLEAPR